MAEHALALVLALLRSLPERARAVSWGPKKAVTLHRASVVIVGAGGIARELLRLLAVFDCRVTIVRRGDEPVEGAARTLPASRLAEAAADADVLVLAAAATAGTERMVDAGLLARLPAHAVLVNVARGASSTRTLVAALAEGRLAGAALDVTDPEPLPDGHPLWSEPRCLITPHSADTPRSPRRSWPSACAPTWPPVPPAGCSSAASTRALVTECAPDFAFAESLLK